MKYKIMKLSCGLLCAALSTAEAIVAFQIAGDSVASAQWDTWLSESSTATTGLSQGAAQTLTTDGTVSFTSSEVTTDILVGYGSPPGGFLGNPDTYYVHDGAFQWNADVTLSADIDYVRVSYALLGFGGGAPSGFPVGPNLNIGATMIDSGSYTSGTTIFYSDFELDSSASSFIASFGDMALANTSFRSIDAIFIEGFNGVAPSAVPEPSSYAALIGILSLGFCMTQRRRNS